MLELYKPMQRLHWRILARPQSTSKLKINPAAAGHLPTTSTSLFLGSPKRRFSQRKYRSHRVMGLLKNMGLRLKKHAWLEHTVFQGFKTHKSLSHRVLGFWDYGFLRLWG